MSSVELPATRVVAFIDILGFRDIVRRMFSTEPALYSMWHELLHMFRYSESLPTPSDYDVQLDDPREDPTQQTTAFSDSLVISSEHPDGVWRVTAQSAMLAAFLLRRGVLCRGGVARGRTFHRDRVLFGPGMIAAYDIERNEARYPRIVLQKDLVSEALGNPLVRIRQDEDGRWFIDVFSQFYKCDALATMQPNANLWDLPPDQEAFLSAHSLILRLLDAERQKPTTDPHLLEKYEWLAKQYNAAIAAMPRTDLTVKQF